MRYGSVGELEMCSDRGRERLRLADDQVERVGCIGRNGGRKDTFAGNIVGSCNLVIGL